MSDSSPERYARLARELARGAGELRVTVISDSMRPLLRRGDILLVQAIDPARLRRGDIVVAQVAAAGQIDWITHRLVGVDAQGWHLRGDALAGSDAPVPAAQIVGRVVAVERDARRLSLSSRRAQIANRLAGWAGAVHWQSVRVGHRILQRSSGPWSRRFAWPFTTVIRGLMNLLAKW